MFAEEEWTDALPVVKHGHAVKADQLGGKHKTISKQCLKRTLQTLGSLPDWVHIKPSEGSDEDQTPTQHVKKKKKKCKKRKKSSDPAPEQEHRGKADVQETPAKKRRVRLKQKKDVVPAPEKREKPEVRGMKGDRMSRQQWKNKMKNKRRSKNKFLNNSAGLTNEETLSPVSDDLSLQRKTSRETSKPTSQYDTDRKSNGTDLSVPARFICKEPEPNQHNRCEKKKPVQLTKKSQLQAKRLRQILNKHASEISQEPPEGEEDLKTEIKGETNPIDRSSALRSRMVQRLESARFRYINELLYTSTSGEAKRMFTQDPDAIEIYHKGYCAQVKHWPANPVDLIISFIQKKPPSLVVADFGCGDCKVARSVKNKVHCFDLAPVCDLVTVCDMANVPLADSTVDIAVFCLSLMGTNLTDFLAEANRVLVMGGVLKIAEVASRFDNIRQFTGALSRLGFKLVSKDTENSHFYSFEFIKTDNVPANVKKIGLQLKPCLYKKR